MPGKGMVRRAAHTAVSALCCAVLVFGNSVGRFGIVPRAVASASEEESRAKSPTPAEEFAARPREERSLPDGRHATDPRAFRSELTRAGSPISRHSHPAVASEHDLRNGIGVPLLI